MSTEYALTYKKKTALHQANAREQYRRFDRVEYKFTNKTSLNLQYLFNENENKNTYVFEPSVQ